MQKQIGERTLLFPNMPYVIGSANIVAKAESDGPFGACFDSAAEDDTFGEESFEKAECHMFEQAVKDACRSTGLAYQDLQAMLGGDLLNQIITANYAARDLQIPFLGLYGACSTMSESLLLGSVLIDGSYRSPVACVACSHFSTAERQYRYPLEMGTTSPPTAQRTVTGAGCVVLSDRWTSDAKYRHIRIPSATVGKVIDYGINDISNMGAAMAPAACDTILQHFRDTGRKASDYDRIVTGDLGQFGTDMLLRLCREKQIPIDDCHFDCGKEIYAASQKYNCGGSGCGCSAVVLTGHLLPQLESGKLHRILFLATGALMSTTSNQQGETIPGIAHAVVLEHFQAGEK